MQLSSKFRRITIFTEMDYGKSFDKITRVSVSVHLIFDSKL